MTEAELTEMFATIGLAACAWIAILTIYAIGCWIHDLTHHNCNRR